MASAALKWLSLVAVIWLQSINGTNTNFPAYSSELKQLLSLSQLQLNNLAFASDAGKLFGWISGIAALYLPLWLVLLIGSTLGFIGYGLQYLFITHHHMMSYWHIFALTVVAGNSICWVNTVCYIAVVRNFHSQLQLVTGLTTSYSGLSAMIYTAMVESILRRLHEGDAPRYLLLNAALPLAVSIISAPLLRALNNDYDPKERGTGFVVISFITALTGVYAIMSSLGSGSDKLPPGINMIGIGVCLALPLIVPLGECLIKMFMRKGGAMNLEANRVCDVSSYGVDDEDDHVGEDRKRVENDSSTITAAAAGSQQQQQVDDGMIKMIMMEENQIKPKVMLKKLNFWLYFLVYFFGPTLGLVYLNNLGQIVESRGSKASSLVTLSSAFGFFGRLLPCLLIHHVCSRSRNMMPPGPALIVAMMVPLSGAFFLLLEHSHLSLCISTAVVALCTGAVTTISVSVTTQLFGTKNFGVNHNIVVANIPLGSFLFGDLAAFLYSKGSDQSGRCFGPKCYHSTFIIWGCLSSMGTLLALVLHFRTRKLYSRQLL